VPQNQAPMSKLFGSAFTAATVARSRSVFGIVLLVFQFAFVMRHSRHKLAGAYGVG